MVIFLYLKNDPGDGSRSKMYDIGVIVSEKFPVKDVLIERLRSEDVDDWKFDAKDMPVNPLALLQTSASNLRRNWRWEKPTSVLTVANSEPVELEGIANSWLGVTEDMTAEWIERLIYVQLREEAELSAQERWIE
jgi:hypothetical protein